MLFCFDFIRNKQTLAFTCGHIEISLELEKFAPKLNQVLNKMASRYPDDYDSEQDWETESQSENESYEMEESNSGKY